jgi:predicted nucleic acid-binding protein
VGSLRLPQSGAVYIDSQILIYTVEKFPQYLPRLRQLWDAADLGQVTVFASELTILETLVVPIRRGDDRLAGDYERLIDTSVELLPISRSVLREAARLRARHPKLRTPDAIHAATAALHQVTCFVTNDAAFRSVPEIVALILDEVSD